MSTTKAEFMAASEATKEALWFVKLLNEITILKEKPSVHTDNQSTIKFIKNPEFHCRTKHIDVRYCFTREYTPTESQAADVLVKILL